jgi:hypothetical protein
LVGSRPAQSIRDKVGRAASDVAFQRSKDDPASLGEARLDEGLGKHSAEWQPFCHSRQPSRQPSAILRCAFLTL